MDRFLGTVTTLVGNTSNASNATGVHHGGHHGGHHGDHGAVLLGLFFPFFALMFGAAIKHGLSPLGIPYTVNLTVAGWLIGFMAVSSEDYLVQTNSTATLNEFYGSVKVFANLDPHLLLYVFLPALIFESAFSIEWHKFKKTVVTCLLLAGPGLVVSIGLTGLFAKVAMYQEWSIPLVFIFGAMLSATDPVAVVALLKELGASKKLATMIEGESLMNDGTAVVVFNVLLAAVQDSSKAIEPGTVALTFVQMAIGGPIFGVFMGAISVFWLGFVFNDHNIEITISLATAYLTFFIGEKYLKVSGVLALVFLGIYYGAIGRTRISPEVEEFLHEFWEYLAFLANTLIFLITGVTIAYYKVIQNGTLEDYALLLALYLWCHVARSSSFALLYPAMSSVGYGVTVQECVVSVYGGLRGAVGLALALTVRLDPNINNVIGEKVLFHCAGIVILTLVINSTTISYLLAYFGMDRVPIERERIFKLAMKKFNEQGRKEIAALKEDHLYTSANWKKVREFRFKPPRAKIAFFKGNATIDDIDDKETEEARRRFLVTVKASYWKQFSEGLLGRQAVSEIIELTDQAIDRNCDMEEWDSILDMIDENHRSFIKGLMQYPIIGDFARTYMFMRLKHVYDLASSFLVAREEATHLLATFLDSEDIFDDIKTHAHDDINKARKQLLDIQRAFPEISSSITTNQTARIVLNGQRRMVHHLEEEGMLDDKEAERLVKAIETQMKKLLFSSAAIDLPNKEQLMSEMTWLETLDKGLVARMRTVAVEQVISKGDILTKQGEAGEDIFLIARGTVETVVTDAGGDEHVIDELGVGAFFGEMAWATECPRFATVRATSSGIVFKIRRTDLMREIKDSKELQLSLWKLAGRRLAENLLHHEPEYEKWTRRDLRKWVSTWDVHEADKSDEEVVFRYMAIIIDGKASFVMDTIADVHDILSAGPEVMKHKNTEVNAPNLVVSNTGKRKFTLKLFKGCKVFVPPAGIISERTVAKTLWKDAVRRINIGAIKATHSQHHQTKEEQESMRNRVISLHKKVSTLSKKRSMGRMVKKASHALSFGFGSNKNMSAGNSGLGKKVVSASDKAKSKGGKTDGGDDHKIDINNLGGVEKVGSALGTADKGDEKRDAQGASSLSSSAASESKNTDATVVPL